MGARGCVVLGNPNFYCRFGFKNSVSLVYADAPARYFQAMAFVEEVVAGQVRFQKAFEAAH